MWSAIRGKSSAARELASKNPLRPRGVIDLAGPFDMRENIENYQRECRSPVIAEMLGGTLEEQPDRYRSVSAGANLPVGIPHVLIWGEHETFMPRPLAQQYVANATKAGDEAKLVVVPGVGHFEIAAPTTSAWPLVREEIQRLLKRK